MLGTLLAGLVIVVGLYIIARGLLALTATQP